MMRYNVNPKNGDKLSALGLGCMRLPRDFKQAEEVFRRAVEQGVNYFDTAYTYPGNESLVGKCLASVGQRDKIRLATKIPPYLVNKTGDFEKIFNSQLSKLGVDFIDYYLIHMLGDMKSWERLGSLGVLEWLEGKKKSGQIANVGFSYHGGKEEFKKLIDAHDWDFTMIQYNYLDEHQQAGREGLKHAASKGLPVMIMEPLRGGSLVSSLPKEVYKIWDEAHVKRTPAQWALSWLWNQPEVTTVLSGMGSAKMIDENAASASSVLPFSFSSQDEALFARVREAIEKSTRVPCTACGYCMPCPAGVDIPTCFSCLNTKEIDGAFMAFPKYLMQTSMKSSASNASRCIKCGKCEKHCPQSIAIRDNLDVVKKELEGVLYRPVRFIVKKFMKL
jgi:predicted aldo/keto reductase-like oxidoreductase